MKSNVLFLKPIYALFILLALGLFTTSCSKEEVVAPSDDKEISSKGALNFFNTYAPGYENLFPEDVWELMNNDPQGAMLELTGVVVQPPFGQNITWIAYLSSNETDYILSAIKDNGDVIGVQADATGSGYTFIDLFGQFDVDETISQSNYFNGFVTGTTSSQSIKTGIEYDILSGLDSDKEKGGFLDAVLLSTEHTGLISDAFAGFAVRKSVVPVGQGPQGSGQNPAGSTETITLGYLAFPN
jgi:hypothetical protein